MAEPAASPHRPVDPARRPACARCLRADCCCACLDRPGVPLSGAVALLLLQHPREQREVKGTARLLHLAVAGSRLLVGEAWDGPPPGLPGPPPAAAAAAAAAVPPGAPWAPQAPPHTPVWRDLLLYPATPGDAALPAPPALDPDWLLQPARLRLVVLDGTWRKSRRMLYDSPWLQRLPRLALAAPQPGRYTIRRTRGAGQLSTFEATLQALAQLEAEAVAPGDAARQAARYAPLWAVFDAFVARQALRLPGACAADPPDPRMSDAGPPDPGAPDALPPGAPATPVT